MKNLELATEANHPRRIEKIKTVCKQFDYNLLTSASKYIRDFKISNLPELPTLNLGFKSA